MTRFRQSRLFLLFVVLLFAAGQGHQMFGRFLVHHHDSVVAAAHHRHDGADTDHQPNQHDQNDAEHMAEHAAFAAIMPGLDVPVAIDLRLLAAVDLTPTQSFEPLSVGIDHPPQLLS